MLTDYRHIVWDWNGTLIDDTELCWNVVNQLLSERKLQRISMAKYREEFMFPVERFYEAIGIDFSLESFEDFSSEFMSRYEAACGQCALYPQARRILTHLQSVGISQSVLSAQQHDTLKQLTNRLGIGSFFEFLVGSEDCYARTKLAGGRYLLDNIVEPLDGVLLVGDTTHDIEVSKQLGIECILVAHGYQSKIRLLRVADRVVDSLQDLLPAEQRCPLDSRTGGEG